MNTARPRPVSTCLALTATVKAAIAGLLANDCTIVAGSLREGHVIVQDGDTKVYQALQKGTDGPWIVAAYNSERITWTR